jgi:hypothetical protein
VDVLGADGTVETITGTTIHPVWSVDRQSWVPLAELTDGETLQGLDGLAVVLSVALSRVSQPVYNIEVHGEHVYQVGELGVLVHNVKSSILNQSYSLRLKSSRASVLSANRKVYNDFLENGGKLIVKRDLIKFGDDGAQILGEFNSVNKTITLFRGSNLSTIAEELIHFKQIQRLGLLGKRIPKSLINGLENAAETVLKQWGFFPR